MDPNTTFWFISFIFPNKLTFEHLPENRFNTFETIIPTSYFCFHRRSEQEAPAKGSGAERRGEKWKQKGDSGVTRAGHTACDASDRCFLKICFARFDSPLDGSSWLGSLEKQSQRQFKISVFLDYKQGRY